MDREHTCRPNEYRKRIKTMRLLSSLLLLSAVISILAPSKAETVGPRGAEQHEMSARCVPAQFSVAIDVGHTANRPGATSASGRAEYSFNVALAQAVLAGLLKAGYVSSFVINPDGADITLLERPSIAAHRKAHLFLSLHHDSVQPRYLQDWQAPDGTQRKFSDRFEGYSVFFSRDSPAAAVSEQFARALAAAMFVTGARPSLHHSEAITGEGRPLLDPRTGVYRFDDLAVLRSNTIPAALLEAGIIVNREEERRVATESFRKKVAGAIASAVNTMCALRAGG